MRYEADFGERLFVVLHVLVRLGRTLVVVEGHARRYYVEHRRAFVGDRRLKHQQQLFLVAGERAAHEGCAELDCERAGVDGGKIVDNAGAQLRAYVGRGRELAFREAIHTVVLDDVHDRQISPHEVDELADADGGGVAVTANAQGNQLAVGEDRAGRN